MNLQGDKFFLYYIRITVILLFIVPKAKGKKYYEGIKIDYFVVYLKEKGKYCN